MIRLSPLMIALTSALTLSACGGGEDSSDDAPAPVAESVVQPEVKQSSLQVTVIDGYLQKAKVWLDTNKNGLKDVGEPSAITGVGGKASLDVSAINNPEQYPLIAVATKGVTIDEDNNTPVEKDYVLTAPKGKLIITPLTTIVKNKMNKGLSAAEAFVETANELGLAQDSLLIDYKKEQLAEASFAAKMLVQLDILPKTEQEA
ncbi:MAG: hypothetical protein GY951_13200, partial [Psychromonas sp.]|nr:hypothetical protein [Psychromonas sp.]